MSSSYLTALAFAVLVVVALRFALAGRVERLVVRMRPVEVVAGVVGVLGLVLHCGAMFFTSTFRGLGIPPAVIDPIKALGTPSIIWYVVPALLVLLAVRRQPPVVLGLVVVGLLAVGITMYDGGPLRVHLVAIFATVVLLGAVAALQLTGPRRGHRTALVTD